MSKKKECFKRNILNFKNRVYFAETYQEATLPVKVYEHKSLIMRKLGNEALVYQENKKINFKKVIPKLTNILIKPGQVFSFWKLVGYCSQKKGFLDGVTIKNGEVKPGTAGGMCQMTNLIHWLVLHSPLDIIEHHHHHRYDLFPDYNRQIPFGTGTSIMYNYLDYRFKNMTNQNFQLLIEMDCHYLKGKLLTDCGLNYAYHIKEEKHHFIYENNRYYRCNEIHRYMIDKKTGNVVTSDLLLKNKSEVKYDHSFIDKSLIKHSDWHI